eukprot:2112117-Rhodomonas_salina.1
MRVKGDEGSGGGSAPAARAATPEAMPGGACGGMEQEGWRQVQGIIGDGRGTAPRRRPSST